ncbi:MAG: SMP-30/gluconolactonase/LRE family protein [Fimbriimonadia bacterium]|nr:SMP-30/gluconolactonase/LRE family protein [Fimbriimonadia bacterium]
MHESYTQRFLLLSGVLASIALTLSACGGGGGNTNSSSVGIVQGRLVDISNTNQPIAGATVSLSNGEQTTTSANGSFQLNATYGNHTLTVIPPNTFEGLSIPVNLNQSAKDVGELPVMPKGVTLGSITINPSAPDGPGGSYLVGRSYQFTATVRHQNGQVLSGWKVLWQLTGNVGIIDSNGNFQPTSQGNGSLTALIKAGDRTVAQSSPITIKVSLTNTSSMMIYAALSKGIGEINSDSGLIIRTFAAGKNEIETPTGVARGNHGELYVCEYTENRVWRLQPDTGAVQLIATLPTTLTDIVVRDNGDLLVLGRKHLYKVNVSSGSFTVLYEAPSAHLYVDMEQGPDGKLYIANIAGIDSLGKSVFRLDPDNPRQPEVIIKAGEGSLKRANAICFVPNHLPSAGTMLVSDENSNAVYRYTSEGVYLGPAFAMGNPGKLAFGHDGKLYVMNGFPRAIVRYSYPGFTRDGSFQTPTIGTSIGDLKGFVSVQP